MNGMVGRTIQLLNAYGARVMRAAVDQMIERDTHDIGALAILCEQHRIGAKAQPPRVWLPS